MTKTFNAKVTTDLVYLGTVLSAMREVSHEITRLNQAAGETVFNPAATGMLRERMAEIEAIIKSNDPSYDVATRRWARGEK